MLYKTQGIVLNYIKYGETSIIAKVFTALFGRQTYIVHGVRTKKAKHRIALFQPLMPLDMVVYHKKTANIQRIVEVKCYSPINNILGNLPKATIAIFLTELLSKVLHEEEHNEKLFSFLLEAVLQLDAQPVGYQAFHLAFMLQLSNYLGFGVKVAKDIDIQLYRAGYHAGFSPEEIKLLDDLLTKQLGKPIITNKATIRKLTASIVSYYQLHIDTLATLKSLKILQEISSEL